MLEQDPATEQPAELPNTLDDLPGGATVRLHPPADLATRQEVLLLLAENRHRGRLAAIGVCWDRMARTARYRYDPAAFAGRVAEQLDKLGWSLQDIAYVGDLALVHLHRATPTERGVDEAENFSGRKPVASDE